MADKTNPKILFIINPGSGSSKTDWKTVITDFFSGRPFEIELYTLPPGCTEQMIIDQIAATRPDRVVAAGGDGTVKLVAACLLQKGIPLGILPAGSANGLAKEIGISENPDEALAVIASGQTKKVHVTIVNEQLCIHLSDIGFNAFVIKNFENEKGRGMWGYVKASFKALFRHPVMEVEMIIDGTKVNTTAAMIVIANATTYGSGAVINPLGKMDDDLFEVIAVKKISMHELYKMVYSHAPFDFNKTAIYQTHTLVIRSAKKKLHFQVDGEYLGRVSEIKAGLMRDALQLIIP